MPKMYTTNSGKQINATCFKFDRKYYKGRIEEARILYNKFEKIHENYSFDEYIRLSYYEIKTPSLEIKQDLVSIISKHVQGNDLQRIIHLIDKL